MQCRSYALLSRNSLAGAAVVAEEIYVGLAKLAKYLRHFIIKVGGKVLSAFVAAV